MIVRLVYTVGHHDIICGDARNGGGGNICICFFLYYWVWKHLHLLFCIIVIVYIVLHLWSHMDLVLTSYKLSHLIDANLIYDIKTMS